MNLAALRVDAGEYAFDGAVLARGIHALKNQQQRPAILGEKFLLKIGQASSVGLENRFGLVLVETALLVGLVRLEMERGRSVEAERLNKSFQLGCERLRGLLAHEVRSSGSMFKRYKASAIGARQVRHCERSEAIQTSPYQTGLLRRLRSSQ